MGLATLITKQGHVLRAARQDLPPVRHCSLGEKLEAAAVSESPGLPMEFSMATVTWFSPQSPS